MSNTLFDDPKLTTTALMPWFGSNRMLAPLVGKELRGCTWVGIPFCGGMAEVAHIKARTIVVSDLHRHVINLASIVKDGRDDLVGHLNALPFHPDVLKEAQQVCAMRETGRAPEYSLGIRDDYEGQLAWATAYFVTGWMGRSHKCGVDDEFNGGLSIRWNANGGDSNKRYRSAVDSLKAWQEIMRRCNFAVMDAFEFLPRCEDSDGHGIYCDPPFPGPGDRYRHNCGDTEAQQRAWHTRLRDALACFKKTKVVCRFYDHPLVRELYPESQWTWHRLKGRDQANNGEKQEVLLVSRAA